MTLQVPFPEIAVNIVRKTRFTEEQDESKQKGKAQNCPGQTFLEVMTSSKCSQEIDCEEYKIADKKLRNPLAKVSEKENLKIESNRRKSK